jgi:hypothetical protein
MHYEILVDASVEGGLASFQVMLDSSEVMVEVIEISDGSGILPPDPPVGDLAYGDLLITEIMFNPSALSDTEGEWFEIYNNSGQPVNLGNLILGRDDINRHTISDSIILQPGDYFVFERSDTATNFDGYNYGSGILLPNTGAILSIFNEGTETNPGTLIFSVDYGGAGFPSATGASIGLDPGLLNATDAVLGTSWCVAITAFTTGDLGTPGVSNDICQ